METITARLTKGLQHHTAICLLAPTNDARRRRQTYKHKLILFILRTKISHGDLFQDRVAITWGVVTGKGMRWVLGYTTHQDTRLQAGEMAQSIKWTRVWYRSICLWSLNQLNWWAPDSGRDFVSKIRESLGKTLDISLNPMCTHINMWTPTLYMQRCTLLIYSKYLGFFFVLIQRPTL